MQVLLARMVQQVLGSYSMYACKIFPCAEDFAPTRLKGFGNSYGKCAGFKVHRCVPRVLQTV
eukprot:3343423-Amphidinium_carterae.1